MSKPINRVKQKKVKPKEPTQKTRAIPEKCRLCAKLTTTQAKQLHSVDGDSCWDSTVCLSRRSHARHRDRRNQARNLKRWQEQGQVALALTDSEISPMQEHLIADAGSHSRIQFETQLPNFNYCAVLQVYRQSVDAPLHAIGGEIWCGAQKEADITPIHCTMYHQLELPLWETLKSAAFVPEDADLKGLWLSVDATLASLDTREQLQVAGDAIATIAQIVQQRSLLTLEEIDSLMQESGPVVPADFFDKFVRQSMHIDFAQFVELPLPLPRQVSQKSRREFPNDGRSVVGVVDKVALLEVVEQEPELSDEAARDKALAVAHDEGISRCQRAIAHWMQHSDRTPVSLLQLQQALGLKEQPNV